MLDNQKNKELNKILKFNGNEEEFKKYNNILKEPFDSETIYYDKEKKQKKYIGKIINNIYKGRGILYDISGKVIYNGHFKNGKYFGFGKLYDLNSNDEKLEYEGFFNYNEFNGKGILYKNGKKKFEGHFASGKYNGIGIEYLSNGKKRRKMKYEKGQALKECYGSLYDDKNTEIYTGILKNGIPEKAKSIPIYIDEYLLYIGDIDSFKYQGEGTLYFEKKDKVFFKGQFHQGEFENGLLYDPYGNLIYEGSFMNGIPKEGRNIKLYRVNANLKYEGDIFNYKYDGYGKLYSEREFYERNKENLIIFDGNFKDGKYDGYGKLYYYDKEYDIYYLYYEGNFKNNYFCELGIRYYKNNAIKIKGYFYGNNNCEGKYYSPENKLLYNGIIINEIPLNSDKIILYNDESYKIYEGKIEDGKYLDYGIEYSNFIKDMILYNGYFLSDNYIYLNKSNIQTINQKEQKVVNALLLSSIPWDGKTCFLRRLIDNSFEENFLATIGIDYRTISYEYHKKKYKIKILDTAGQVRFRSQYKGYLRNFDILLFLFDLSIENTIDIDYFNEILGYIDKKTTLIYFIGNKLDITKKYIFNYRKQAKLLYDNQKIDKYFEVSSKSGEGIDELKNVLKIDSASIIDNSLENKDNPTTNSTRSRIEKLYREYKIKSFNILNGKKKLNKYLNY